MTLLEEDGPKELQKQTSAMMVEFKKHIPRKLLRMNFTFEKPSM